MADATIIVNLTLIDDADDDPGGYERVGTGGNIGGDGDVFIQDSGGSSTQSEVTTIPGGSTVGIQFDNGSTITFGERDHLFVWQIFTAPFRLNTTANGGQRVWFTDGSNQGGNRIDFYVGGNEAEFLTGGWKCDVASPNVTPQEIVGSPSAPYQAFGGGGNGVTSPGKDNYFIDVQRYGRGLQITDGDDVNPGTMKSITDVNDTLVNQYGVLRAEGAGGSLQGEVAIGFTDGSSTVTYFSDTNYSVFNRNKNPLSGSSEYATLEDFTGIRILGSGTTCIFNNFAFTSADEYDRGYISCVTSYPFDYSSADAPLDVDINGCTFISWGQTRMSSTTAITNSTWIGCNAITLGNGTIENCTVEAGIGGTYVFAANTPNNITDCSFIGDGTGGGHAFEVTSEGTYAFVGNSFSNFGDSDTDDAAVHINGGATGIAVTFNITGGGDGAFSYKLTGTGTTVTFVSAVTVNITGLPVVPVGNGTEIRVLGAGTTSEIAGVGTENHRTDTYTFSITSGADFDLQVLNLDFVPLFVGGLSADTDPTNVPISLKLDRVYEDDSPPSGE